MEDGKLAEGLRFQVSGVSFREEKRTDTRVCPYYISSS
jgi:hypothetical protein